MIYIEDFELIGIGLGDSLFSLDMETLKARYESRLEKPRRTARALRGYLADDTVGIAENSNSECDLEYEKHSSVSDKAESSIAEDSNLQNKEVEQNGLSFLISHTIGANKNVDTDENLFKFITLRNTFRLYDYITHDPSEAEKSRLKKSHIRYMRITMDSSSAFESDNIIDDLDNNEKCSEGFLNYGVKDLFVLVESPVLLSEDEEKLATLTSNFAKKIGIASVVHVYFLNVTSVAWFGHSPELLLPITLFTENVLLIARTAECLSWFERTSVMPLRSIGKPFPRYVSVQPEYSLEDEGRNAIFRYPSQSPNAQFKAAVMLCSKKDIPEEQDFSALLKNSIR